MIDQQLAVKVRTAAQMTEISETTIRDAIRHGELAAFRVGREIRIFVSDLKEWLENFNRVGSPEDREELRQ